ncbi:hypothetical protein, partial [Viscerimonas tarda]
MADLTDNCVIFNDRFSPDYLAVTAILLERERERERRSLSRKIINFFFSHKQPDLFSENMLPPIFIGGAFSCAYFNKYGAFGTLISRIAQIFANKFIIRPFSVIAGRHSSVASVGAYGIRPAHDNPNQYNNI